MDSDRSLLEEYVGDGKLMQLATQDAEGPWLCNVWYRAAFSPDRLYFISNLSRHHSQHIKTGSPVAGAIVHQQLDELGQKARGVTFRGTAAELPVTGVEELRAAFVQRWPKAAALIDADDLAREETPMRLYEVAVREWVLVDEVNLSDDPRRVILGV
jgi:uncharacterized protein YhbP (UPF0306 family)